MGRVFLTHQIHPLSLEMLVTGFECQPCAYNDACRQGSEHSLLISADDNNNSKRGLWRADWHRVHATLSVNSNPSKSLQRVSDLCHCLFFMSKDK